MGNRKLILLHRSSIPLFYDFFFFNNQATESLITRVACVPYNYLFSRELNIRENETGIFRGTLISRFGQTFIVKGTKFCENWQNILICINKQLL